MSRSPEPGGSVGRRPWFVVVWGLVLAWSLGAVGILLVGVVGLTREYGFGAGLQLMPLLAAPLLLAAAALVCLRAGRAGMLRPRVKQLARATAVATLGVGAIFGFVALRAGMAYVVPLWLAIPIGAAAWLSLGRNPGMETP